MPLPPAPDPGAAAVPAEPPALAERGRRAAPMAPEDRRDAIVVAAIPLLAARGASVTTRELADAACVAEGTLFRVFPDKTSLVRAAVERALDPKPLLDGLGGVERDLPLRHKLRKVVALLGVHASGVVSLLAVSHELATTGDDAVGHLKHHRHQPPGHGPVEKVVQGVAGVLHPHAGELRLDPDVCARLLVGLVLAAHRPLRPGDTPRLTDDAVATLFCDGAVRPTTTEDPC